MSMLPTLRRDDGFNGRGDEFYEALMLAHAGLAEADSAHLNARLILILANQIGDLDVLTEALGIARASLRASPAQNVQATDVVADGPTAETRSS
jgi:hypothetical protein